MDPGLLLASSVHAVRSPSRFSPPPFPFFLSRALSLILLPLHALASLLGSAWSAGRPEPPFSLRLARSPELGRCSASCPLALSCAALLRPFVPVDPFKRQRGQPPGPQASPWPRSVRPAAGLPPPLHSSGPRPMVSAQPPLFGPVPFFQICVLVFFQRKTSFTGSPLDFMHIITHHQCIGLK